MTCKAIKYRAMTSQSSLTTARRMRDVSPAVDALAELGDELATPTTNHAASHSSNHSENQSNADMSVGVTEAEADVTVEMSQLRTSTPMPPQPRQHPRRHDSSSETIIHCDTPISPDQSAIHHTAGDPNTSAISSSHNGDTSTMNSSLTESPASYHSMTRGEGEREGGVEGGEASHNSSTQTVDEGLHETLRVPIVGYEVMEERARFTIFKVQVRRSEEDTWFIFRRYTDFVRLNDRLKRLFPHFRLALPPKRWFGDNYDRTFLDDRLLGLQAFVNNVAGHKDVLASAPVRRFFCLDEPPGPHESLEESRALCESLEETNYLLQRDLEDRDARIALLQEELELQTKEIHNLKKTIKLMGKTERRRGSAQSELSITETSALAEADQQRLGNIDWSEVPVTRRSPIRERGLYDNHRLSLGNMSVASMERVPEEQDRPCDRPCDRAAQSPPGGEHTQLRLSTSNGESPPSPGPGQERISSSGRKSRSLRSDAKVKNSATSKNHANGSKLKSKPSSELEHHNGKNKRNKGESSHVVSGETNIISPDVDQSTLADLKQHTRLAQNDVNAMDVKPSSHQVTAKPLSKPDQSRLSVERDCDDTKSMTSSVSADSIQIIDHGSGKLRTYRSAENSALSGAS